LSALDFPDMTARLHNSSGGRRLHGMRGWVKTQLADKAVNPASLRQQQ